MIHNEWVGLDQRLLAPEQAQRQSADGGGGLTGLTDSELSFNSSKVYWLAKSCGLALVVTVWLGRLCVLPTPGSLYLYLRALPQQVWTPLVVKEGHSMSDMVGCRKLNVSDMQFSRLIRTPALGHFRSTSMSDM